VTITFEQIVTNVAQKELFKQVEELVEIFKQRANRVDLEGAFTYENFADLKKRNFLALTVPKEYGGGGINLVEFLLIQERLAQGDAPTSLSLGWQLGVILEAAESRNWKEETFAELCKLIVNNKALTNLAQTEQATGSPSRGGIPTTTAIKEKGGWRINGSKAFTSMAIALDYSIVTADINLTGKKGFILVDHKLDGVRVEETWDSVAMRGTKSDDLFLDNVLVDKDALLVEEDSKNPFPKGP
jgi:alkylation response protein AidB-like acyl-CoA dehydrogenase